jgi:Fic family protein
LSELTAAGELIPNQTVLINSIPILEAQASSEIENIVTTADRLFRYARDDGEADPATKEALRYRTALSQGFSLLSEKPLCTDIAIKICRVIRGIDVEVRATPGTALRNTAAGQIVYTPPEGEARLRELLTNWERFIHDNPEIDPLVRMAVAHYQFEAIHPFTDGNGRTGRILNLLLLIEAGVLDLPVLYLSRYIIRNRAEYYRLLLEVTTDAAWEDWVFYMVTAAEETAAWTTAKIRAIRDLIRITQDRIRREAPRIYSRELVEIIFVQPYCRIRDLVEADIAKRQSASSYLKQMCELGVLREIEAGREKLFINLGFLELLTGPGA